MKKMTVKGVIASLPFVMFAGCCDGAEYLPGANSFGIFTTESRQGRTGCASLDSDGVAAGTPVDIVVLSRPQRVLKGTVTSQSSAECTRYFGASGSAAFYNIGITQGKFEAHELGVVVLPGATVAGTKRGEVMVELGQKQYRLFECAGRAGIHVGVRSAAAEPRTIWHDYLHVGIDVDPTCRKTDYAGIEALKKAVRREGHGRAP